MRNVVLWSRAIDRQILTAVGCVCLLAFAGTAGLLLPAPEPSECVTLINAFVTAALLLIVWAGFRLVRPFHYNYNWQVAEPFAVALAWVLLVSALGIWLNRLHAWDIELDRLRSALFRNIL
jgi:hypothetical protein